MSGNVQTRIRPITGRLSLLPTSQARTAIGVPRGTLSWPEGQARYGVSTFHSKKYAGLGACCRPGGHGPRERNHQRFSHLQYLLVQAYQPFSLVYTYDLYHRFRYLHLTGYLALTRLRLPGGHASRDLYPAQTVLRYIVRAALDSCP